MLKETKHFKISTLLLLLALATLIYFPSLNYQLHLSQGDHGLNLYAAEAITRGELPYRDFHWFYGPLMPYYYGLIFTIFGASIKNMLLGKAILTILCSILIFLTLSLNCSASLALIGGLFFFFFQNDFFYTYNHIGGITINLAAVYFLCLHLKTKSINFLRISFILILTLGMIKLNLGVISLIATLLTLLFAHQIRPSANSIRIKKSALTAVIMLPVGWAFMNGAFIYKQPFYIIKQGFQYFGNDAFAENYQGLLKNIYILFQNKIKMILFSPLDIFLCILTLAGFFIIFKNTHKRPAIITYLFCFLTFYGLELHEYLISGVYFRGFWADSFILLFVFTLIGYLEKNITPFVRIAIIFFLTVMLSSATYKSIKHITPFKTQLSYFDNSKAEIYIGNNSEWRSTINTTIDFINQNLSADEMFFAAPYDPIYYFLTNRKSPSRQLAFFDFIDIPAQQEENIINELEKNHVNWIFLSNRINSNEAGLGLFGQTNSPIIAQYIKTNFEKVAQYGNWQNPAGWVTNTGMRVYKRK